MFRGRLILILFLVGGLWVLMLGRGAYLQFKKDLPIAEIKQKQFSRMIRLAPRRGDILDREGREMAVSVTAYSLFADPAIIDNPSQVAKKLASHFKMSFPKIHKKLRNKKRRFVWIKRRLRPQDKEEVLSWGVRGLAFKEEFQRIYPGASLAAPVLGFVGQDQQGLAGVELKYEEALSGAGRKLRVQRDARGRALVKDGHMFAASPGGADLVLTLDKDLQFWVESQLRKSVELHEAESAWAVVLDAETSEVLAMANHPSYDANQALVFRPEQRRNKVVQDIFESGSVMKSITVAGALEQGVVEPNTLIDTEEGHFEIGRRVIREADKDHAFDKLTVTDILAHSSNVGTAKIALRMQDKNLNKVLRQFGFGKKTGVELPGEARGLLAQPPWRDHLTANISFGHGVGVTALQVATAYAAIANGGWYKPPRLIKEIRDPEKGSTVKIEPPEPRQILSARHAKLLKMMLSATVSEGRSGYRARVEGFPVAGKTGTAQKVDPNGRGYLPGKYISSFAGFVPVNDPKYVIYVVVDSPSQKQYYASQVAAPLFHDIAQFALRRDRSIPVYISDQDVIPKDIPTRAPAQVQKEKVNLRKWQPKPNPHSRLPNLEGLTLTEVLKKINGQNVEIQVQGEGRVSRSWPQPGTVLQDGEKVRLKLSKSR